MCGIVGILNIDGSPVSMPLLKEMTNIQRHRGPDDEGYWVNGCIGFGHRRLSIIDLSHAGHQPMVSPENSHVITYNGEIYNFHEIRRQLEDRKHVFFSRTDTEVILKAYQEWGKDCLYKFNGMFSFAVWDETNRELFVARDRYGIKPLYYYHNDTVFIFASEIKAIIKHPLVDVDVNLPALKEYFTFQNIFTDKTLFNNIKLLPPGSYISLKPSSSRSFYQTKYWDYSFQEPVNKLSENEYIEELDRLFTQAVTRQLISDVPVGSYLSGGMDSASITAIASSNIESLNTFTCGFDLASVSGLELGFDEREKARSISSLYNTSHHETVLKAGDMEDVIGSLVWSLEDLRVGQSYPNYYAARLAGSFVKVVLSGAGGDELFAGYPWRYYRTVGSNNFDEYVQNYYFFWQRLVGESSMQSFLNPDIFRPVTDYSTLDVFRDTFNCNDFKVSSPQDCINYSLYFEIKTFLHGLFVVEDKLSMAHSLETRLPFMDNDLVDFAMNIPVDLKIRNLNEVQRMNENEPAPKSLKYFQKTRDGKIILRKLMERYVPSHITDQLKQGFSAPDATWFRGQSIGYIKDLLLNKKALIYEYIQRGYVERIINDHTRQKQNYRLLIWSLICFEWWLKIFKEEKIHEKRT